MKTACLALLLSMFLLTAGWAAPSTIRIFTSGPGGDYPLEDAILNEAIPNVLFYLDVSAQMTMSMRGQRPTPLSQFPDANVRMQMLREDTFGMGGRPLSIGTMADQAARRANNNPLLNPIHLGTERVPPVYMARYQRWGRDVYDGNNIIGCEDSYYSLCRARPYLLTFRDPVFANWNGIMPPPSGFPSALISFLPVRGAPVFCPALGHNIAGPVITYGQPVPLHLANQHLVPNDSKIYAMKLVLSRILSPDRDNMETLSRMRIGVATTFYERFINDPWSGTVGNLISAGMKNYPFRFIPPGASGQANYPPQFEFFQRINGVDHYNMWHNGTLTWMPFLESSGIATSGSYTHEFPDVQFRFQPHAFIHGGVNSPDGVHHVRSIMHIPFDVMYTRVGANYYATPSLIQFREMIDGVEQINYTPGIPVAERIVNDEFFITAIPGSAERLVYNVPVSGIIYAEGTEGARMHRYNPNANPGTYLSVIYRRIRNSEDLMTGTVAGGILDFFSPRPDRLSFSGPTGPNGLGDTRGFFPVTSSCQGNWIIYFTTGNEANPGTTMNCINVAGSAGNMMHSLGQIFRNSAEMRGREDTGGGVWIERNFVMENPIRTIVVGLVSTEGIENDGNNAFVPDGANIPRNLRNRIRRMAHAGQPIATRNAQGQIISLTPNTNVQPIFADNVPALLEQLNAALVAIRTERLAGGAPRIDPAVSADGSIVFFSSSYLVDRNRQWDSNFARFRIPLGETIANMEWEADALMRASAAAGNRNVHAVDGNLNSHHTGVRTLQSMVGNNALRDLTGTPGNPIQQDFGEWLTSYRWVNAGQLIEDNGILGSMERTRPAFVPRDNPSTIFIQTNRGVVHALNYVTGQERWAFIPPPVFLDRIWRQKFRNADRTDWIDGDGVRAPSSVPLLLLDGLMSASTAPGILANPINPDIVAGRTFLMGAAGLAGNSLYMLDVTHHATENEPTFMWSIDNDRFGTARHGSVNMQGRAWLSHNAMAYIERMKGWESLGLTTVAPEVRELRPGDGNRFVGFVPGGLGYNLGVNAQGGIDYQGRAFFVFNPLNGNIIRKITNAETRVDNDGNPVAGGGTVIGHGGFVGPPGAVLGMGVTPVYYVLANPRDRVSRITSELFTGDSEGNILHLNMRPNPTEWELRTIFRARTIEPGSPPNQPIALPVAYELVYFPGFPHVWVDHYGNSRMGARWLFGGTANVVGPGQENHPVTGVRRQRGLYNAEQYIFALNLRHLGDAGGFRGAQPVESAGPSPSFRSPANPPTLADLTALNRGGVNGAHAPQPAIGEFGWKLRLAPPNPNALPRPTGDEYVTAPPHFNPHNGVLYVATFTPFVDNAGDLDLDCGNIGFSRLYAFEATTGRSVFGNGDSQFYQFHDVKIVGISSYARMVGNVRRGSLLLGIQGLTAGAVDAAADASPNFTAIAQGSVLHYEEDLPAGPVGDGVFPNMLIWREDGF